MAYDINHLMTVGHMKTIYDKIKEDQSDLKSANNAVARRDNTNAKFNTINRGNIIPRSIYAWHYGSINNSGADNGSSTTRIRSDYLPTDASVEYRIVGNARIAIYYYNSSKTFISYYSSSYTSVSPSSPLVFTTPANTAYVRFVLIKDSQGYESFTTEDIANFDFACYKTDNALDGELRKVSAVANDDVSRLFFKPQSRTLFDVTFTFDPDTWTYTVNGTSTVTGSDTPARASYYEDTLPTALVKGGVYKLVIDSEDSNIEFYSRFQDANNTTLFSYVRNKTCYMHVPANAAKVWMRIQTVNGSTVNNKKFKVRLEYQKPTTNPIHIPVIAYNVGAYNHGYAPSAEHVPPATSQTLARLKEFFRTHQADIIATEEGQEVLLDSDLETETNMNNAIYNYQWPYYYTAINSSNLYSPSLHLRYPAMWSNTYTDSADRRYVLSIVNIQGVPVAVAAIHFSPHSGEDRIAEFTSVINKIADNYQGVSHYIIMGDFNAGNNDNDTAAAEYKAITDAGYHSANGGWWGTFNTYRPNTPHYIDSVVTTANIDIVSYDVPNVYDDMPSDHLPLCCELVLYPDGKNTSR